MSTTTRSPLELQEEEPTLVARDEIEGEGGDGEDEAEDHNDGAGG